MHTNIKCCHAPPLCVEQSLPIPEFLPSLSLLLLFLLFRSEKEGGKGEESWEVEKGCQTCFIQKAEQINGLCCGLEVMSLSKKQCHQTGDDDQKEALCSHLVTY